MVLVMAMPGAARDAVVSRLEQNGRATNVVTPDCDDPFSAALEHKQVVYIQHRHFDDVQGAAQERMRAALSAAHAPGIEVLVVVLPHEGCDEELGMLAKDGVPYVVLRVPTLIEELGGELDDRRWLFVARDATTRAIEAAALAKAVHDALDTEEQGQLCELGDLPLPVWAALERAAEAAGHRVRVVALWPPLFRALSWLAKLLRRRMPPALEAGRLLAMPASSQIHPAA